MTAAMILAGVANAAETGAELNARAIEAHRQRNVGVASSLYRELVEREPPMEPSDSQRELVLRLAPRLHTVASEFFPLKDVAAFVHPRRPVIAYHLFWDDDIGFPADNEPCDHEVVWIEYDPATRETVRVSTYFHGHVIAGEAVAEGERRSDGRAWIGVEWGFHGSLPWRAWERAPEVEAILTKHWRTARAGGLSTHPLARGWPRAFAGDYASYLTFTRECDPQPLLRERGLIYVSEWATATIDRYCLRYNFAAKTEWPWLDEAGL